MIKEHKIKCPNCNKLIPGDSNFCNYCGITIEKLNQANSYKELINCPNCHKKNEFDSKFCVYCGEEISITIYEEEIIEGSEILHCPNCNKSLNQHKFLEYLNNYNRCPKCRYPLDFWEFKSYVMIVDRVNGNALKFFNEFEKNFSIICSKCNNLIPKNSKFCMFCGFSLK